MAPTSQPTNQPSMSPSSSPLSNPLLSLVESLQRCHTAALCPAELAAHIAAHIAPHLQRSSSVPSSSPSKYPTTSVPQQDGDTNAPSDFPTSAPTLDLDFTQHFTYLHFLSTLQSYSSMPNSFSFGTYYFKGLNVEGNCDEWTTFIDRTLMLPFDDVRFSAISLSSDTYNFGGKTSRTLTAVCSEPVLVNQIISLLQSGDTQDVSCEGHSWRVFACNDEMVLCVDCKRTCVKTEGMPRPGARHQPL